MCSCGCAKKFDDPKCWGWVVVVASFVGIFLTPGLCRSTGVFYNEWMGYFDNDSAVISTLGITLVAVMIIFASLGSMLVTRFGARPVVIAGGVLASIGFFASSFAPNVYVLFGTYGVISGLGFSLTLSPFHTVVVHYFEDNAGLTVGLVTCSVGVGGTVLPFVLGALIDTYHWRGTFIVLSALSLNICVCGALLRPPPIPQKIQADDGKKGREYKKALKTLYTNRSYILYCVATFFMAMGTQIPVTHVKAAMIQLTGVSDSAATLGISLINAGDFVGVVACGIIFNRCPRADVVSMAIGLYVLMIVSLVLFPQVALYPVLVMWCGLIGIGITPQTSMVPLIARTFVGIELVTLAYGFYGIPYGLGTLFGPMFAGFIYDNTKDYANSFYVAAACAAVHNLLMLEPCISNLRKVRKKLDEGQKQDAVTYNCSTDTEHVYVNTDTEHVNAIAPEDIGVDIQNNGNDGEWQVNPSFVGDEIVDDPIAVPSSELQINEKF